MIRIKISVIVRFHFKGWVFIRVRFRFRLK